MRSLPEAAVQTAAMDFVHALPGHAVLFDNVHPRPQASSRHWLQDSSRLEGGHRATQTDYHRRIDFDFDFDFLFLF
jgi:hypothetical protein